MSINSPQKLEGTVQAQETMDGRLSIGLPKVVTSINGVKPDENGNIELETILEDGNLIIRFRQR